MPYRTFSSSTQSNSTRKRVNIVTFRSTPSPVVESGKQEAPRFSRRNSTAPNSSSTSSGNKAPLPPKPSTSAPIIAPKFRRQRGNQRNASSRFQTQSSNQRSRPGSSQSQAKATPSPPPLSTGENSDLDPYAWVEDEEEDPAPKLSEFAVTEDDEGDDGSKPWFWPSSRDISQPPKPSSAPQNQTQRPQGSLSSTLKSSEWSGDKNNPSSLTNGIRSSTLENSTKNDAEIGSSDLSGRPLEGQERSGIHQTLSEINYLINGLNDVNSADARCHKILTLANKCISPAKRDIMHAYKLINPICAKLQDVPNDYCLGFATAGLFFIISRDRDPDFLTPDSLNLLLRLLKAPNTITEGSTGSISSVTDSKYTIGAASRQTRLNKEAANMRSRVRQLLEAVATLQQKRRNRNSSPAGENASLTKSSSANSKSGSGEATGMAALFARKNPGVSSLFSGISTVSAAAAALNTRHLRMNRQLTARDLVLEAILNLATRRAAPWFKVGIRTGGGLDGVADATIDAVDYLKDLCTFGNGIARSVTFANAGSKNPTGLDDFSLDNLKRIGHYAKMLENMTCMDTDNQTHLVRYRDRALIDRLVQCVRLCASRLPRHGPPSVSWLELLNKEAEEQASINQDSDHQRDQQPPTSSTEGVGSESDCKKLEGSKEIDFQPDQQILLNCLLAVFRLFVNISHSEYASDRLGGCPDLLESTLDCLFHLPDSLPSSSRFDLLILILCLLANLCEHCPDNRIRIVHLELRSPESSNDLNTSSSTNVNASLNLDDVGYEDDEGGQSGSPRLSMSSRIPTISALDEVVKLFLFREKRTLMHEFERDEDGAGESKGKERTEEADSTTNTTGSGGLQRPKPPPSLLTDDGPETIEEAGLKWRLIGNKHERGPSMAGGDSRAPKTRRLRMRAKRRKRRQALLKRGEDDSKRPRYDGGLSSEDDTEEECEEDEDEMCSDDDDASEGSEEDFDDDEMCSGADVEFVAETQEEQEKLKERMTSAKQHMEDSVVAAYAALLLGCILQSSPRYAERIRSRLPEPGRFRPLAIMLAKLASFLSITRGVETAGSESILRIVRILEAQDQPQQPSTSTNSSPTTSTSSRLRSTTPPVTRSALRARHEI
ncbi:hypothetical protein Aperf_G00000046113 [Anoplocephala perfoliata]